MLIDEHGKNELQLFQRIHQRECQYTHDEKHNDIVTLCIFHSPWFRLGHHDLPWSGWGSDRLLLDWTVAYHLYYT